MKHKKISMLVVLISSLAAGTEKRSLRQEHMCFLSQGVMICGPEKKSIDESDARQWKNFNNALAIGIKTGLVPFIGQLIALGYIGKDVLLCSVPNDGIRNSLIYDESKKNEEILCSQSAETILYTHMITLTVYMTLLEVIHYNYGKSVAMGVGGAISTTASLPMLLNSYQHIKNLQKKFFHRSA